MTTATKNQLRGGQDAPLSRLKHLEPEERAEIYAWRYEEQPTPKLPEIRARIKERFGIVLRRDGQLSLFWPWQRRQGQWDRYNEMVAQDEQGLADRHPGVSREKLREATIKRMYAEADLEEDPKFTLKVIATDLKDTVVGQDDRKLKLLESKAAKADAAEGILQDKALNEQERAARMRELFGMS